MTSTRAKNQTRPPRRENSDHASPALTRSVGRRTGRARCPAPAALGVLVGALGILMGACTPRVAPRGPGPQPEKIAATAPETVAPAARAPLREVLVGEMCPHGADGRPAVKPLFVRGLTWSSAPEDAIVPVERRAARQFSVLAWDGRRAGLFSVAGAADVGDQQVAVGAYAGSSPCARPRDAGDAGDDPACVATQVHCGLAMAVLDRGGLDAQPFEEDPAPASFPVAGTCVAGDNLIVDIDGDGTEEAFPVAQFVNPVRGPAEEVVAVPRGNATCAPGFAVRHAVPPGDPRHWRGLDVLGVVDVDGDGRRELILAYHYAARRTWAVYSALSSSGRLDLVGEAEPWPIR